MISPSGPSRSHASFERVAVLGLGLIGGSLLHAIAHAHFDVIGYDVDPRTQAAASASGFTVAANAADAVVGADLVVLAMPLTEVHTALEAIASVLAPGAVLTDVGTLKMPVVESVATLAPQVRFVGGHPLAGTEESGWDAADALLFRDAPWTLTLEHDTDLAAWLSLAELVCDLGARPIPTSALEQDAAVARVIGLPHVLAEALALTGLAGGPLGLSLAAGSYRDGSRVARTRPELVATWCDQNPALVGALDEVIERLTAARDDLASDRSMYGLAVAGHSARMSWEHRKFGQAELEASVEALLEHGGAGGWVTAVVRGETGIRLLGMRPTP